MLLECRPTVAVQWCPSVYKMEDRAFKLQRNLLKFVNHVENLTNEEDPGGNGFNREYRSLREMANKAKEENTYPATVGREPYNIKKNRYKDIVPYDSSRVILTETEGIKGSDYINANLIKDVHNKDAYIASQGPLPHTVIDFWRMVWEYEVKVIVMACKLVEGDNHKKKCAPYWPVSDTKGDIEKFGDIQVKLVRINNMASDCIVRTLEASFHDEVRTILQLHYTGWPDHGIPDDIDVILAMIQKMREIRCSDGDKAPIVVHCSAGCGRTGTICAIDYAWEVLKSGNLTEDFNLFEIIQAMREQRQSMIQTPDQFEMAHLAVRALFQKHLDVMEENIYVNTVDENNGAGEGDYVDVALGGATSATDDDEDIYSLASATKAIESEAVVAVNAYTNDELPKQEPPRKVKPQKPEKEPPKKPPLKVKPNFTVQQTPTDKNMDSYENVFTSEKYQNVTVEEKAKDKKHSDQHSIDNSTNSVAPSKPQRTSLNMPSEKKSGPIFEDFVTSSSVDKKVNGTAPVLANTHNNIQNSSVNKLSHISTEAVGDNKGGKHVTVIKCTYNPNEVSNKAAVMTTKASTSGKEENNNSHYSLASSGSKESETYRSVGPVFESSTPAVYSVANHPTKHTHPQSPTQKQEPVGDLYSSVDQTTKKSTQPKRNTHYDEVIFTGGEGLYAVADLPEDNPPVPERGYRDPAPSPKAEQDHKTDHSGPHTLKKKFNIFGKKDSSAEHSNTDHIPGFKKRIAKSVEGPREQPSKFKLFSKSK